MLPRLLARRGLEPDGLARATGVPEVELAAVFAGAEPSAGLLRRLAPLLGWHASDLFLVAGLDLPDDLAPAGRYPGEGVISVVWSLVRIPEIAHRVHGLLLAVRRIDRAEPSHPLEYEKWVLPGFGAVLLRLFGNRNMTALDAVQALYVLTGFGPWSAATLRLVGLGRKEVPPDLVAACAVVLDIPADDLAALAGTAPVEPARRTTRATQEAAALIWEARRIPGDEITEFAKQTHAMRHEYDNVLPPGLVCHCSLFSGERSTTAQRP